MAQQTPYFPTVINPIPNQVNILQCN